MNPATNTATDVCPSEHDLRAFSLGKLPVDNIDTIGLHIAACSRCDTLVDAIQQDTDALIAQIRDWMKPVSFESENELQQLESHARAIKLSDVGLPRIQETEVIPPQRDDESVSQNSAAISTANFGTSQRIPRSLIEELPGGIGRYVIQKKLGDGGFAHVYLAYDPELNRHVAIKVPRQDRMTEATAAQFLAEGQAAAALGHPSITKVFDWGRTADGMCYVVMEYIAGESLSDAIKSGKQDQSRAIQITIQVADALHYMHKNSLVHRDVKPANILLDASGNAHLSDFGLAVHDDNQWLHRDELAGTRPYMSPEQVRGELVDGLTDIWSLGVVLYELLTGGRPFSGTTAEEVFYKIQEQHPKSLRMRDETIPTELADICLKCLSKAATNRYSSAIDLASDLQSLLTNVRRAKSPGKKILIAIGSGIILAFVLAWATGAFPAILFDPTGLANPQDTSTESIIDQPDNSKVKARGSGNSLVANELVASYDQWLPILQRPFEKVAWNPFNEYKEPNHDRDRGTLVLQSNADWSLLSFGKFKGNSFKIRFVATIDELVGFAGFFWWFHDDLDAFPEKQRRCMVVTVGRATETSPVLLRFEEFTIRPLALGFNTVQASTEIIRAELPLPSHDQVSIEMHIRAARIESIYFQDDQDPVQIETNTLTPLTQDHSAFGLVGLGKEVVFENVSLMLLKEMRDE